MSENSKGTDLEVIKSDIRKLRYDFSEFTVRYDLDHEPHSVLEFEFTTYQKVEIFSGAILLAVGVLTKDLGRVVGGLGLIAMAFYFNEAWGEWSE